MQKMNNVLMIAYFFPPIGGSGALRPLKLAKYLPKFGWVPVILTVKNPDWYYAYDKNLLIELPKNVQIVRTFMFRSAWIYRLLNPLRNRQLDKKLSRFLIQPDNQIGWVPFAYSSAISIMNRTTINAIYSTSSPLSSHLVAYLIHKRTGVPWVADFRDEWYENPDLNFPTYIHRRIHFLFEKIIVNTAHKVIAPAPEFCRLLAKHCRDSNKFMTLTMGYDPDDFLKKTHREKNISSDRKFVLLFSGLFYGSFRPDNTLKAINELIEEGKVPSDKIKVLFVGANTPSDTNFKDDYGICEFKGFVSHRVAINYIKSADVLLLLLSKERGENVIPSKTFEYMASGNPILAVIPINGDLAAIIRETKTGVVVDFDDVLGTKNAFLQFYKSWEEKNKQFKPDLEELAKYDQRNLSKKLASLLDDIALI